MKQKIIFLDFNATIVDVPGPENGRNIYFKKTGQVYPHIGWWSKPVTLDMKIFDIKLIKEVDLVFQSATLDPNAKTVLLTNRIPKMVAAVRKVLNHHKYKMDLYSFNTGQENKGERILKILETVFPDATDAEFYDDDSGHLDDARIALEGYKVPIKLFHVIDGKIAAY